MGLRDKLFKQSGDKDGKSNTDVYISYSSIDAEIANEICSILEMNNIKCWIAPRDIQSGSNFVEGIANAIKNSDIFILTYSASSKESKYVQNELSLAFNENKKIISFNADSSDLDKSFYFYLKYSQWADSYDNLLKSVLLLLEKPIDNIKLPNGEKFNKSIDKSPKNDKVQDTPENDDDKVSINKSLKMPFEPYEGDEPYIFISYKHSDSNIVYPVISQLHDAGFNIWYDAGLEYGKYYDMQIAKHIKNAKLFITFFTKEVINCANDEEDYLIKELSVANMMKTECLAIFLEDVELDGYYLLRYAGKQSISRYNFKVEDLFIDECINVLKNDFGLDAKSQEKKLSKEEVIDKFANGLIEFKERSVWKNEGYDGKGPLPNDLDDLHNYLAISQWENFQKDSKIIIDALASMNFELVDLSDGRESAEEFSEDERKTLDALNLEQVKNSSFIDFISNMEDILRYGGLKLVRNYIYVSYAHRDANIVFQDIKKFQDYGLNISYDDGISTGRGWVDAIENMILNSSLFLVFISPDSVESKNIRDEIFLAISEGIPIIPIYLEETELKYGLGLSLGSVQSILRYSMSEDEYIHKCLKAFNSFGLSYKIPEVLKRHSCIESFYASVDSVSIGDSITLTGKLESDGEAIANEKVSISDDDSLIDTVMTNTDGEFSKEIIPDEFNSFNFKAIFDGNDDYETCESSLVAVVVKKPSSIDFSSSSDDVLLGDSIILSGRVDSDGVGIAKAKIHILDNDSLFDTVITNGNGEFSKVIIPDEVNTFNFKAIFDGNDNYVNVSSPLVTVDVRKPSSINFIAADNDIFIGDTIILSGRLESDGEGIPKVRVSILDDDSLVDTVITNNHGEFSKVILADKIDTFNFKASFDGAGEYKSVESSLVTVAVKKSCSIEFKSTFKGDVLIGRPIALLGELECEGDGINEAEVAILDGDNLIATVFTSAKGEFSHVIFTDSPKTYRFQAIFEGNEEYGSAGSAFMSINVVDPKAKVKSLVEEAIQSHKGQVSNDDGYANESGASPDYNEMDSLDEFGGDFDSEGGGEYDSHKSNPPFEAYEGEDPYIFVSYKHVDHKIVYPVIKKLHDAGFNLWYDAGLHKGKYYDIQIASRIKNSSLFITFFTKEVIKCSFNGEDYVIKEFNAAKRTKRHRLEIFLEDVEVDGFYLMNIEGKQQIFRHSYDNEDLFIAECVKSFKRDFNLDPKKK